MARYPDAIWKGEVPNKRLDGTRRHNGLILHIEQGTEAGTDSWFHNPASQASAHFGNPKSGAPLDQWVDTDDAAWAQAAGNPFWTSCENEGQPGDALTAHQIDKLAELYAWGHVEYGWPFQITDTPDRTGLGWHGMGGAAWGGHPDCPGEPIKQQRQEILDKARALVERNNAVTNTITATIADALDAPGGGAWVLATDGGVFAFHGAPFHGSYPGLPPSARQGGTRTFVKIDRRDDGKPGYMLIATDTATYRFP
jgi:hypothetical protein